MNELDRTLLKIHDECIQFLKRDKQVIIVKTDKGGCTVAMLRADNDRKMSEKLNDTSAYVIHNSNPTSPLEVASNALVEKLYKEKIIDEPKRKAMTRYNTQLGRIYALPKIHKANAPLRPVVSTIDSPSTILSNYMDTVHWTAFYVVWSMTNTMFLMGLQSNNA